MGWWCGGGASGRPQPVPLAPAAARSRDRCAVRAPTGASAMARSLSGRRDPACTPRQRRDRAVTAVTAVTAVIAVIAGFVLLGRAPSGPLRTVAKGTCLP
jgi:hypothetical protein